MLHVVYVDVAVTADVTVDTKFIDIIRALPEDEAEACILSFYKNAATLEVSDITVRSYYLEGAYPDTERNLSPPSDRIFKVPKEDFTRALKVVQVVTPRQIPTVKIEVQGDQIILSANTPEVGQVREVITVANAYQVTFNIDAARLLSTLKCIKGDDVTLQVDDPLSPAIIREGSSFMAVVALIRTSDQIKE